MMFSFIPMLLKVWWLVPMAALAAWGVYEKVEASHYESQLQASNAAFVAFKEKIAADAAQEKAHNAAIVAQHTAETAAASIRFATQLTQLRKAYHAKTSLAYRIVCRARAGGVRLGTAGSSSTGNVPTLGNPSSIVNATAANAVAPAQAALIEALPEACTVTTQQLVDLQDWVRQTR